MQTALHHAYILHSRPYQDSSAILDCFSSQQGLISVIARGAKRPRSRQSMLARPFIKLQIAWCGKGDLKTLTQIEAEYFHPILQGSKILLGLYLNELILRLIRQYDPHVDLFQDYDEILKKTAQATNGREQEIALRIFELKLLMHLGYGVDLLHEGKSQHPIESDLLYTYDQNLGIIAISEIEQSKNTLSVSGASIQALEKQIFETDAVLRESKKLLRYILACYLGAKPLNSRQLFAKVL